MTPAIEETDTTKDAIRSALRGVTDPELDRSIVELDYIEDLEIEDGTVTVAFALPTAWCSPTFAWMMATDARDAISELEGVGDVRIVLRDHMHATEVTRGVNEGMAFSDAFETADGDIAETRATLDRKARLARQYDAIKELADAGLDDAQLAALRREDIDFEGGRAMIDLDEFYVEADADPLKRYLEKATSVGVVEEPGDRLFVSRDGDPLATEDVQTARSASRLAKTNMGGQGGVCASLHAARNPELASD